MNNLLAIKDWKLSNYKKIIIAILTTFYFLYYIHTSQNWHFIDNLNLVIHEAGHTVLFLFGHFISILGGSLFQILIPSFFVFYFFLQQEYFSSYLLLFWVGQNFINVSVYASDAINMNLPLLGGDGVIHDWNEILNILNLLQYTNTISQIIYLIGFMITILASILTIYISIKKETIIETTNI